MTQLKDIPRGSILKVALLHQGNKIKDRLVTFHHVKDTYSFCTIPGTHMEEVVYLSPETWLDKIADYYVVKEQH